LVLVKGTVLEQPKSSYGVLLVHIILGKLPQDIRRNLAHIHTNPVWTITELQEGILTELRVLESGESLEYTPTSLDGTLSTMTLLTGASKSKQRSQPPKLIYCTYCNVMDHTSFACKAITDPKKNEWK